MPNKRQLFLQHIAQTSTEPMLIEVDHAFGCEIFDVHQKRYLDLNAGICVCSLGHAHPTVVEAVQQQSSKYMHTMVYGEHIQSPQVDLATTLTNHLPEQLNQVYFTTSGSEAVEGAMKLAKKYTQRYEIISCASAYHGSTHGSESLRSDLASKQGYLPMVPGIKHIRFNEPADLDKITTRTAAVITEVVQAEWGIRAADEKWLQLLRQKCDETGTLLVFDEIQTGYGRTGYLFAFEKYGVVPDILLLAKGIGGGMPLGAFVSDQKIMNVFTHHPVLGHITTFGGHPVCCAAGLATLQVLLKSDYIASVLEKEKAFKTQLVHAEIIEVRSVGLMIAVQLKDTETLMKMVHYCWTNGVLLDWYLFDATSLRISPPLIISEKEITEACEIIKRGLDLI